MRSHSIWTATVSEHWSGEGTSAAPCLDSAFRQGLLIHSLSLSLCFVLVCSGILHVSAVDKTAGSGGSSSTITISNDSSRLRADEIQEMLLLSAVFAREDQEQEQIICAKQSLQAYVSIVRNQMATPEAAGKLDASEREGVATALAEAEAWLKQREPLLDAAVSPAETIDPADAMLSAADFSAQQSALESVVQPSLKKLFAIETAAAASTAAEGSFQQLLGEAISQMQQASLANKMSAEACME